MSARSLNKVQLIGNLTRDPELRYTPSGTAVCTFGLATNRSWTTQSGELKEETEFHRIVSWNKLAELCSQLLVKGRKVYVEGRLSTRTWTGQDNVQRTTTEIVIEDMIILDSKKSMAPSAPREEGAVAQVSAVVAQPVPVATQTTDDTAPPKPKRVSTKKVEKEEVAKVEPEKVAKPAPGASTSEEINPDDIPF